MEKINNNYYVYVYMNPFVPYDKSVLGYYFTHTPYYIGKGKYDRWKHHINESIKYYNINIYKERKVRKILNELNNNITELYKTVLIIEYFDNEYDALLLEYNLINLLGRKVYNNGILTNISMKHPNKELHISSSKYDNIILYDASIDKNITINNYRDWCKNNNISESWIIQCKTVKNRFSLPINSKLAREEYLKRNTKKVLYKKHHVLWLYDYQIAYLCGGNNPYYCKEGTLSLNGYFINKLANDKYYKKHTIYKDDIIIVGTANYFYNINTNMSKLIDGTIQECNGYFISKELNDKYYKKHTIYKDMQILIGTTLELSQKVGFNISSLINTNKQVCNGYFKDKELNDTYYKKHILYKNKETYIDILSNLVILLGPKHSKNINDLIYGNRNMLDGYFINKELNNNYYKEYTVYKDDISLTGIISILSKYIGKHTNLFINSNMKMCNGYFKDKELNDTYYKRK